MAGFSLVIRADATPAMGTGHVMRGLALAQAAMTLGMPARMVGRIQVPWVAARLQAEGLPVTFLPGAPPPCEAPADLLAQVDLEGGEVVVLDGYHFGPDCQRAVRAVAAGLVVVDDYAHLPEYCCDILLNQNIGAQTLSYAGEVGEFLLGPDYALLRREFLEARAVRERTGKAMPGTGAERILLSLGGGDASAHLAALAPLLSGEALAGRTLRVIAGAMPEARVRALLENSPARVEVCAHGQPMPELLLWADACITAGGSTCWELCCLGVPFLTLAVAGNQRGIVAGLEAAGLAPCCDAASVAALLASRDYEITAERLMAFVDGQGCRRVLRRLWPFGAVTVRTALPEDSVAVLNLANDREVRACSLSSRPITAQEHQIWYANRLELGNGPFFLAFCGESLAGYARYDRDGEGGFVVSTAFAKPWRGLGLGSWLLAETAERLLAQAATRFATEAATRFATEAATRFATEAATRLRAWVKPDNIASQRAFARAGYTLLGPRPFQGATMVLFQRSLGI